MDKDEDSRDTRTRVSMMTKSFLKPEGAEEDTARAATEAQARKHRRTPPTAKKASIDSEVEPLCKRRHGQIT